LAAAASGSDVVCGALWERGATCLCKRMIAAVFVWEFGGEALFY